MIVVMRDGMVAESGRHSSLLAIEVSICGANQRLNFSIRALLYPFAPRVYVCMFECVCVCVFMFVFLCVFAGRNICSDVEAARDGHLRGEVQISTHK